VTLTVHDIHFSYRRTQVLSGVSFRLEQGSYVGLLGPNGSGKSTLTKILAGVHKPKRGTVNHDGIDLRRLPRKEQAKRIAYVPQSSIAPFVHTVREAVLLGRTPYFGFKPTEKDWAHVEAAIDRLWLRDLADRNINELSGGQAQRVLIARALAQDTPVLLLDEPTSALDLRYQVETLHLLHEVTKERKVTALIAIHDLNHAARFCDKVLLLSDGLLVADDTPADAFDPRILSRTYQLDVEVELRDGIPEVTPSVFKRSRTHDGYDPALHDPAAQGVRA
jgi:iron complex transport system ATP-binding protein